MKIHIDETLCIGCGICANLCPDIFEMDDSGKAKAHSEIVPEASQECTEMAIGQCPVSAIIQDE